MPSPSNHAVIAAAGSRKTQLVIEAALAAPATRQVLITTYTRENRDQIIRRLQEANGCVPPNVSVLGWFTFLINEAARPYQSAITGQIYGIKSINIKANLPQYISRDDWRNYYFDRNGDFRPEGIGEFPFRADQATGGRVIRRLEALYDELYIDEFQDMAGYDLDFLDLLFASKIAVTVVGDPRQYTYSTNRSKRNKQYRGPGIVDWLKQRSDVCSIEERAQSWRCNQAICDWADCLYPGMSQTTSMNTECTGHDGIFRVASDDVPVYVEKFQPTILRWNRTINTLGLRAMNIGVSKGSTFDRVLIFPTKPIVTYLLTNDLSGLKAREHLYVAATRARHSVTFVVDRKHANYML